MTLHMYHYPRCGTCRKAKKFFDSHGITVQERNIVEKPPTREELEELIQNSGLSIQKFFNTSGKRYRELQLSQKQQQMTDNEKLNLLTSDGMLIKRPIVTDGQQVTVGFREDAFTRTWLRS